MYRLIRTGRVKAGKNVEAFPWAKAGADLMNKKYPGHKLEANYEVFGALTTLHWTATYADLADAETFTDKLNSDEEFMTWSRKGTEYIIEGSLHDTLMRSI